MLHPLTKQVLRYSRLKDFEVNEHFLMEQRYVAELRTLSYREQWMKAYRNRWFHVRFHNLALLNFQFFGQPSFQYLACPLELPSYSEFVDQYFPGRTGAYQFEAASDYAELLDTSNWKDHVHPIRYDCDPNAYRAGSHPLAHIHMGVDNNVRIALRRYMSPLAFLYFIIRQEFPENWIHLNETNLGPRIESVVRESLEEISSEFFNEWDHREVYLF